MEKTTPFLSTTFLITSIITADFGIYATASGYDGKVQLKLGSDGIQVQVDGTGRGK